MELRLRKNLILPALIVGCLSGAAWTLPQRPDGNAPQEYRARREALAEALRQELAPGDSGALVLDAAPESESSYRQESNLYYLTGTEIPDSSLVLLFDRPASGAAKKGPAAPGRYAEFFYLPGRDFRQERWTGPRPGAGGLVKETLQPDDERREAMRRTGFERIPEGDFPPRRYPRGPVESRADFASHLARFLADAQVFFHLVAPGRPGAPLTADLAFVKEIREEFPLLTLKDPAPALARMRAVKSPAELQLLRRAIEITCQAQRDALKQARSGMAEFEVQALVEYRFTSEGARRPGYPSIVGSGPNSCILHYDASAGTLREGDLLLMDVGAEYGRYTADVTRTIPVSGRFSEEQRKIYDIVLKAQKAAIAAIRPGVPFSDIDKTARRVIEEAGYGPYFIHGTSHFLGLDVHDAGDTSAALQAGMVLTVEPGIYLPEKQIGIRIEDDVLVTRRGAEVLSDCAPREPGAVEMQRLEGLKSATR
ncbi:MAG TPA: Xaa-Pro peptidase family protein [Candidatus Polarisedimenticolia bacterium]|jgi:Xaa-Pro aminopeptidase|nr:Xaa-Pro peptidase family protein [Candidatus Polarisedimenticolia bacterium]